MTTAAEHAAERVLTLPLHEFLTERDVDEICWQLLKAIDA
jgi:dTDP-4-amino-4,6-dideoxygalactose transaminase